MRLISGITQANAVTVLRFLYPIWAIVGLLSLVYIPSALIVPDDAAATVANIKADELLFRMGIIGSLVTQVFQILVVLYLYKLFLPVNKNHSILMVIFALVGVPIAMYNTINQISALLILSGADYLGNLGAEELNAQTMFFLDLNEQGIFIATIFWGLWLFPLGYLIFKSGYFPRALGVFVVGAGVGFLLDAITHLLLYDFAVYKETMSPIFNIMTIGEILFILWLIFRGAKIRIEEPI